MGRRKLGTYAKDSPEESILKRVNEYISIGSRSCEGEHRRIEDNANFERGNQWAEGDAARQKERERPALPLNGMHKLLNAVANREIMDRFKPKVHARGREDAAVAQLIDSASLWQRDMAETEHEETLAFRKMCSSGYGVMHKWWDPTALDGDGMLVDEEVPLWNMLWDPTARRQNFVDRRWHLCGKYIDLEDVEPLFGESREAKSRLNSIKSAMKQDSEPYGGDESLRTGIGGSWGQIRSGNWTSRTGKEVFVIEAEWKERKNFFKVAYPVLIDQFALMLAGEPGVAVPDPTTGQEMTLEAYQALDIDQQKAFTDMILSQTELRKFDKKEDFSALMEQYESIAGRKFEEYYKGFRESVQFAIITDNTVLDHGERSEGFTYEFMTGFPYETPTMVQFYGMVDVAKAPQDFKNVFYSNLLTLYMTSPKQHLLIEEGALKDTQQFLTEYSKVTGVSIVPDGFVQGGKFLQLESPKFPPMLESLINVVDSAVQDIFGLSSIEMNTQGDLRRISGNVVQSAKAATNTLLAILFDGLRRYRKRFGLLTAKSMLNYYNPDELREIIGDDYEFLDELKPRISAIDNWPVDIRFNIKIDEAPTSITEQMETVDYLTRTGTLEKWVAAGELPFEEALDLLVTIPKSVREKIKRARAEKQKVMEQMQQLQSQIEGLVRMQESFVKFIQAREGGAQILADFSLLQTMADQMHAEMMQQQQQQQQQQQLQQGG